MWIEKTDNNLITEHVELMFYTRWAKTLIGVRIGARIKCGSIECDIDDVTHFTQVPFPNKQLTNAYTEN